jgi:hypothetical protein
MGSGSEKNSFGSTTLLKSFKTLMFIFLQGSAILASLILRGVASWTSVSTDMPQQPDLVLSQTGRGVVLKRLCII